MGGSEGGTREAVVPSLLPACTTKDTSMTIYFQCSLKYKLHTSAAKDTLERMNHLCSKTNSSLMIALIRGHANQVCERGRKVSLRVLCAVLSSPLFNISLDPPLHKLHQAMPTSYAFNLWGDPACL